MVGIYVNKTRDIGAVNAKKFMTMLEANEQDYCVLGGIEDYISVNMDTVQNKLEMIVVFGGDGTVLHAFKMLNGQNIPIIGVNAGNLGFLTEIDINELEILVKAIKTHNYSVEARHTLSVEIGGEIFYAVNDCALSRGNNTHTIRIELRIDGKYADKVSGDGMLVSTPTGSTAYALSCGGPILNPDVAAFVVLAICPHTLHSRPMVISDKSEVELIADNTDGDLVLNIDGDAKIIDRIGQVSVKVTMSERKIEFIRLKEGNFYNKLINKLNYWNKTDKEI